MPVALWLLMRILRAVAATVRLLTDWKVLRRLPWAYIRTLPRRNRWIGLITVTLALSLVGTILAFVYPAPSVAGTIGSVSIFIGLIGVASSWVRALDRR